VVQLVTVCRCRVSAEQAKNDYARQIMTKILDTATWINIHQLPVSSPLSFTDFMGRRCLPTILVGVFPWGNLQYLNLIRSGCLINIAIVDNQKCVMAALCNRAGHYIFALWFLSSTSVFFFPRLISAATDWMSTILLHMAWP